MRESPISLAADPGGVLPPRSAKPEMRGGERALARQHQLLLRAARAELRRRGLPASAAGREQDDLAHQAADDALLAITSKLDRFRGESRFTTWACKFVMLEVSAKLGCHYWRNPRCRCAELGSTRNALYKIMFDVRRKIRAHLVAHGYLDAEGGTP